MAASPIPEIILSNIAEQGHTIKSYCEKLGHQKAWLLKLYTGESAMSRFSRVAQIMGRSIDELVDIIEQRKFDSLFNEGLRLNRFSSRTDLAKRARVSEGFIKELSRNSGELKTIKSLVDLARDLNLSLADICPGRGLKDYDA